MKKTCYTQYYLISGCFRNTYKCIFGHCEFDKYFFICSIDITAKGYDDFLNQSREYFAKYFEIDPNEIELIDYAIN